MNSKELLGQAREYVQAHILPGHPIAIDDDPQSGQLLVRTSPPQVNFREHARRLLETVFQGKSSRKLKSLKNIVTLKVMQSIGSTMLLEENWALGLIPKEHKPQVEQKLIRYATRVQIYGSILNILQEILTRQ